MWKRIVFIALAIGVFVLIGFLALMVVLSLMSWQAPDNLGVKDGKLAVCPETPNCVSSQAADEVHRVEPLRFGTPAQPKYTPGEAWAKLVRVVSVMRGTHVVDATESYMHVECSSAIFRFVDDLEFVMDEENQVIHVRAASRVGRSDMGANRARVEAIRTAWEKGG
jgi:uncharacterized protein (DUF1499 family)